MNSFHWDIYSKDFFFKFYSLINWLIVFQKIDDIFQSNDLPDPKD